MEVTVSSRIVLPSLPEPGKNVQAVGHSGVLVSTTVQSGCKGSFSCSCALCVHSCVEAPGQRPDDA